MPTRKRQRAERHGEPPGIVPLRRSTPVHRLRRVEHEQYTKILFIEIQLQKERIEPSVDVPINETKVISSHIWPMIRKVDA